MPPDIPVELHMQFFKSSDASAKIKVVELRLLDPTLEKLLNSGMTVRTSFEVTPGSYVIRLVVRDSEGQTMAAHNGVVEIPDKTSR
jgi:hypothetical protein